ncbi:hypothetical protein CP061683_0661A, partial [Chlamydia psittaci 06-1683]
MRGENSKK